ncbi:hypothetical protein EZS27_036303 [termite gut metagenome]|uniref:DUF2158 domain-containing protein n=1 Tax=termite gut metagenome TaxID=433724 RepID=A0A5J4PVS4_9ZZZZ
METEQKFKEGYVVNLKSDTIPMTIESILEDGSIECVWHDNKCTPI